MDDLSKVTEMEEKVPVKLEKRLKIGEKREVLLNNGAKFVFEGEPIELPEGQKRFFVSTPGDKNGYFEKLFREK